MLQPQFPLSLLESPPALPSAETAHHVLKISRANPASPPLSDHGSAPVLRKTLAIGPQIFLFPCDTIMNSYLLYKANFMSIEHALYLEPSNFEVCICLGIHILANQWYINQVTLFVSAFQSSLPLYIKFDLFISHRTLLPYLKSL